MTLDLFSGIGGFSLAGERAGVETAAFCEINPFCRKVLAKHWPGVPIFEDVQQITRKSLRERGVGPVDALCGGWPCQGNSVAGKREGHRDERSGLFREIVRLADELHPRWLLLENVPGLVSVNGRRDFASVITQLRRLGYVGCVRRLDAQHFGLAQRRSRLFFVGGFGTAGVRAVHAVLEGGGRYPAPSRGTGQNVATTLDVRAGRSGETSFHTSGGLAEIAPCIPSRNTAGGGLGTDFDCDGGLIPWDPRNITSKTNHSNPQPGDACPTLHERGASIAYGISNQPTPKFGNGIQPTINAHNKGGGFQECVAFTERGRDGGREFSSQEELAYTLTNPGNGGRTQDRQVMHGHRVRRLTPTEAERLQGFSWRDENGEWQDGWTCLCGVNRGRSWAEDGIACKCTDSTRYKSLGNAVAVPCVEWMWRQIMSVEEPSE